ncbi:MAG TPA: efflux RND transporter periplasmic adaptor subunit [Kofleriaceae bacterium]|jgi:RND family efflux transporter MFP subunit|nr:efflux RND transporter periplasmic adaptor subunit [Kofleriaceae bacterium]
MASNDHGHGEQTIDPKPYRPSRRRLITTGAVAITVLSTLAVVGMVPRLHSAAEARDDRARAASEPARVQVEKPMRQGAGGKVVLPGTIQAVQDAIVYARTSGYVRSFTVDIGDTVKAGQVLATLDTPDIDQELRAAEAATLQARANIDQAKTQLELASKESSRYQTLAGSGVVSQQDMEEHRASYDARGASLKAIEAARGTAEANLQRLRELKGFATVVAPFDGVVTSRAIELGQLVAAGTGQAMFHVANTSTVRVFVNVPQVYASAVKVGDDATISLRELPQRPFTGKVTRSSHALDPATRTLLTEIRIANPDGALLPGMYAELALAVSRVDAPLMIRPAALVADANGTRVAVVEQGAIKWRDVKVDSDLGDQVAILSGLQPTDDVVVAPSGRLAEGLRVVSEPAPRLEKPAGAGDKPGAQPAAKPEARSGQ